MSNEEEQAPQDSQEQAENSQAAPAVGQFELQKIPDIAIKVIVNPVGFYQGMPKSGGLLDPLIFMVALAVVAGVLSAILSGVGLGIGGGLAAIILIPIFVVIFGFAGAGIMYGIWKLLGSQEDFETAFRCVAYTAAIAPATAVLGVFPYIGSLASAFWPMGLLALASIHVHGRDQQTSWAVFGAIGVILALISVGGEMAGNKMDGAMQEWQEMLEEQRQQ